MEPKLLTAQRFVDMRTGCMCRYVISDTEYLRPHYHDFYEIFIVLNGNLRHLVGDTEFPLTPRDMVFIRPDDLHDHIRCDSDPYAMINITFTQETLRELLSYLGEGFPGKALLTSRFPPSVHLTGGEFRSLIARITAVNAIPRKNAEELKTALRCLLFDLFTKYFSTYTNEESSIPAWLESLCSEMRRSAGFVEGSERLFAMTDKSREHVCRSMKKYMGVTVTEFINDLRLNYICNMLLSSNRSITDIVFDSGFNNLSWASELFREKYGLSMRQFRKQSE